MDNRPGGTSGVPERTARPLLVHLRLGHRMPRRAARPDDVAADRGHPDTFAPPEPVAIGSLIRRFAQVLAPGQGRPSKQATSPGPGLVATTIPLIPNGARPCHPPPEHHGPSRTARPPTTWAGPPPGGSPPCTRRGEPVSRAYRKDDFS